MPSKKAVNEYQELYFRRFGVRLSETEATEQAAILLRFYMAVYGDELAARSKLFNEKEIQA